MSTLRLLRAAPLGIAAAFALALAASGQTPPPGGTPPPSGRHTAPGGVDRMAEMQRHMQEHRTQMLADWSQVLKLTPAQSQALSTAMTRPERGEHSPKGGRDRAAMASETTLQRLDRMQTRMTEREGHMREHLAAMRAFYTSLNPDQQKSFDALTRLTHGGMHGHHGMGGHRGDMSRGWGRSGNGGEGGQGLGRGMRHGPPPPPAGE